MNNSMILESMTDEQGFLPTIGNSVPSLVDGQNMESARELNSYRQLHPKSLMKTIKPPSHHPYENETESKRQHHSVSMAHLNKDFTKFMDSRISVNQHLSLADLQRGVADPNKAIT